VPKFTAHALRGVCSDRARAIGEIDAVATILEQDAKRSGPLSGWVLAGRWSATTHASRLLLAAPWVDSEACGPTFMGMTTPGSFTSDIAAIRKRARQHLDQGALTPNYGGDVEKAISLLNDAVATEIVCVLRYRFHAVVATGLASDSVKKEFEEHAADEEQHLLWLAERINQLGGKPEMNPAGVSARSATEFVEGSNLVDMVRENLVAERIAIETYRDLIRYFTDKDPTTRSLLEKILAQEEDHANDMHDLLVSHEGTPMLDH
jgi:bacterioferritin